jgi:iron complex transport system ATP-binding protein
MTLLSLRNITVLRGRRVVVDDISVDVHPHEFMGIIGPNGAGKTTLMRAALGLLPYRGQTTLAGMPPVARARACAWLPQAREVAWAITVADLVALGRTPWGGHDPGGAVPRALARMGLEGMALRSATALSGGEQARALIARALAQDTPLLLADEPIAGLDPAAQIRTMQIFADLAHEGRAVIASIHDLGLAARHCTRLLFLSEGRLVADGPPDQVLDAALLDRVFGLRARIGRDKDGILFQALGVTR